MLDRQLIPRKLSEEEQVKLALRLSQYSNLNGLLLSQHDNQIKLHEAEVFDIKNEMADALVMQKVLAKAIKFSTH